MKIDENIVRNDNSILAFKTPKGKFILVLTNRFSRPFRFQIETSSAEKFKGYCYTSSQHNIPLGTQPGKVLKPTLPDLSIAFLDRKIKISKYAPGE